MPLPDSMLAALAGLAVALSIVLSVWAASVPLRDASLVDRFWPWLIAAPAGVYLLLAPGGAGGAHPRAVCVLALVLAWALRLSLYLTWRNWGHGEDRRYRAMRAARGPAFAWQSLYTVFVLQAVVAWAVCRRRCTPWHGARGHGAPGMRRAWRSPCSAWCFRPWPMHSWPSSAPVRRRRAR